jgi:Na+/proline symporter
MLNFNILIPLILVVYFIALFVVARVTSKNANSASFYAGNKQSPWYLVAFGMIGTSLSGVTFVSVPGSVGANGWSYYQLVIGFFLGYFAVAYILLPLYYKYNLTSIYSYLSHRLGFSAYQWGAGYFILSRTLGATVRLYLVINVMQTFVFEEIGIPFWLTTLVIMLMIIAYTLKGGVKTIVWTDTLQTTFMLLALVVCIFAIQSALHMDWGSIWSSMKAQGMTKLWETDVNKKSYFLKHVLGGAFITIAMTGLDQEMMQKNISVKTLNDAQKNMVTFSFVLLLVNALFMFLGGLLYLYANKNGWEYAPDDVFPSIVQSHLSKGIFLIFIIGLISALFPSVDGAITALTSSFCIDILGLERSEKTEAEKTKLRKIIHLSFAVLFIILVFIFKAINSKTIVDLIFLIAGYTYGPLLGLFAFGIFTKRNLKKNIVPVVCLLAPLFCYCIDFYSPKLFGPDYKIGNEMLIINGAITFILLYLFSTKTELANEISQVEILNK